MTAFSWRMAVRETRAGWRHFLYFFFCIALGVGALVSVSLFATNVELAVSREARSLLGGDLEVRSSRALSQAGEAVLASLKTRGITSIHVSELVAMAASASAKPSDKGHTQLVELKAVEAGYPWYGEVRVDPALPLRDLLTAQVGTGRPVYGAVVQDSLLIRLGLEVGDRLTIGQAQFVVTGLLRKEPDRVANLFSLGPRVMVSREALAATRLVQPGSRVRERYLLKVPADVALPPLMYELRGRLADERPRVLAYHDAQPRLRRFLDNLSRYLGLIGLTALFVGGIGVATTVQAFLREKFTTIAILKTLGADSRTILRTYLLQAMLFGLLGSGLGALVGVGLQRALPPLLTGFLPHEMVNLPPPSFGVAVVPVLKGLAMGMLTTVVFALWPLLRVREIRPAFIFRREVETGEGAVSVSPGPSDPGPRRTTWRGVRAVLVRLQRLDRVSGISAGLIASGLLALAMWEARSVAVGLLFLGGLTAAVMLLLVTAWGLVRGLARLARGGLRPGSLAVRQALANVYRPGSQATAVLVSVGVGVTLIVAVALVERALIQQLGENRPDAAPTFFFIDIQPDQADAFRRLLAARVPEAHPVITPLVRSRLHTINGETIKGDERPEEGQERREGGRQTWYYTRDYVLTFLQDLPEDNVVIRGDWWAGRPIGVNGLAEVSVEEEAARQLGLTLGTTVAFDIQGSLVKAVVTSIRRVDWSTLSTNFFMILSPGSLDGAPVTYVATVRVAPEAEVPLQEAVVAAFPNVTAINIGDVLATFSRIVDRLSFAIQAVALFCILAGGVVMATALATTRYRRLYESVLLKALGATRSVIARSFATEYALLGAVAGLLGLGLASLLSWAFLDVILDLAWTLQPAVLATALGVTVLLTLTVGFLTTFRILGQRPLTVLRQE